MTVFGAIFEVSNSIGKLWNLFGYFGKKGTIYFHTDFIDKSMLYVHTTIEWHFSGQDYTQLDGNHRLATYMTALEGKSANRKLTVSCNVWNL